jgi:hypothetical protein
MGQNVSALLPFGPLTSAFELEGTLAHVVHDAVSQDVIERGARWYLLRRAANDDA